MFIENCFVCGEKIVDMHSTTITKKNIGVLSFKSIDMHDKCFSSISGQEFTEKLASMHNEQKDLCEHGPFRYSKADLVCVKCGLILYDFYVNRLRRHGIELKEE